MTEQCIGPRQRRLAGLEIAPPVLHHVDQRSLAVQPVTDPRDRGFDRPDAVIAHHLVHQPQCTGLVRIDRAPADHQPGGIDQAVLAAPVVQPPRQPLGAAVAWQQVQVDLGLTEPGVPIGDHHRAGEHQFVAAA
jgi:hypothetical protein